MRTSAYAVLFQSDSPQFELARLNPHDLEFEEFDNFAGDVSDVAHAIECDGIIVPEYKTFGCVSSEGWCVPLETDLPGQKSEAP